jgi:hypothetical protein
MEAGRKRDKRSTTLILRKAKLRLARRAARV